MTYLNEDKSIDALLGLVRACSQILVDVLEIRHEHVLHEVLILLDVILLQKDLGIRRGGRLTGRGP
jgi:hypothetical protein